MKLLLKERFVPLTSRCTGKKLGQACILIKFPFPLPTVSLKGKFKS
jgi:hypothetical protein